MEMMIADDRIVQSAAGALAGTDFPRAGADSHGTGPHPHTDAGADSLGPGSLAGPGVGVRDGGHAVPRRRVRLHRRVPGGCRCADPLCARGDLGSATAAGLGLVIVFGAVAAAVAGAVVPGMLPPLPDLDPLVGLPPLGGL